MKKSFYSLNISNDIWIKSIIDSTIQLNPIYLIKNPIMFLVGICLAFSIILSLNPVFFGASNLTRKENIIISVLLLLTLFFSNLAENIAKHLGKNQAENLRTVHGDIEVKKVSEDGYIEYIFSSQLKKGDVIKVQEGDLIPLDGEIVEGIATVDESAITGESSLVLKEAGTYTSSSVTGGTRVMTDYLLIKITSEQGETYLDQMLYIAEETERHKSENELSLNALLVSSTISSLLSVTILTIVMSYLKINIEYSFLISLLICIIPTTIGSLLTPITISGFEKINSLNVLALSRKSVESAGDINYVFLDKTGTLTYGNRMAIEFIPINGHSIFDLAKAAYISSLHDQTPEGKSILVLARKYGINLNKAELNGIPHEFSAHTRMSGIDLENKEIYRKGAVDAIIKFIKKQNGEPTGNYNEEIRKIAITGGSPLLVSRNEEILGIINLKDIVKPSIISKFKELNAMGVTTVMCTGDNDLTAKVISKEAGIDEYIAEAKPEEKIKLIKYYQSKGLVVAMVGDGTNDAPALAQADIGLTMNNGTTATKEAANMIDLDSDPTKIIEIIKVGRQLLTTRGALTTFSIINDITKYYVILPSILPICGIDKLNFLGLHEGFPTVISALIFNTIIIPLMTPIAIKGISIKDISTNKLLENNLIVFGIGGILAPLLMIKVINMLVGLVM